MIIEQSKYINTIESLGAKSTMENSTASSGNHHHTLNQFHTSKNINDFGQLYNTMKLNEKEIAFVQNLRNFADTKDKTYSWTSRQQNPPKFYEADEVKYLQKNKKENHKLIYPGIDAKDIGVHEHLLNGRLGPCSNQHQLYFETNLREQPYFMIHPKTKSKFNEPAYENKKWHDLPSVQMDTEPNYPTASSSRFTDMIDKIDEITVRPFAYKYNVRVAIILTNAL